jgi:hypothetical protein
MLRVISRAAAAEKRKAAAACQLQEQTSTARHAFLSRARVM